jgi:hypothetical protein
MYCTNCYINASICLALGEGVNMQPFAQGNVYLTDNHATRDINGLGLEGSSSLKKKK